MWAEGKVPGTTAGPAFHVQPWSELRRCLGTRVSAQDVVFDDTWSFPSLDWSGGERKRLDIRPLLGLSPLASSVSGSNPPSSAHPSRVFSPPKIYEN